MGQSADQIRREIEETRNDLGQTLDAIGDRVSPKQAVRRRTARVRNGLTSIREIVMGKADDMTDAMGSGAGRVSNGVSSVPSTVKDTASGAAEGVSSAASTAAQGVSTAAHEVASAAEQVPQVITRQTRGNPLAAGLVAFGAGLLVSSLLPVTDKERQLASQVSDQLEPLQSAAREAGEELKGELTSSAREAAEHVMEAAKDATSQVADQAQSAAQQVKEEATGATSHVAEEAQAAAQRMSSDDGVGTSRQALYEQAQALDVPGRSQMTKEELAAAVRQRSG